ncbi:MAG: Holliday junction resolvase RuvX [Patescibacteria group bacterium]
MNYKTVLGVDYGTKRIGLAISRGTLAIPLQVIFNIKSPISRQLPITKIKNICRKEEVELIVMGLSEDGMAEQTKGFAKKLQAVTNLPLEYFDETLSSQEVEKKLKSKSIRKSKRLGHIDHYAAAQILQEWMDTSN